MYIPETQKRPWQEPRQELQTTPQPATSSPTTQAWDEKAINTGTHHMLMNRGLQMGIIQPHTVLKTWQGQQFYLAKRASGQPLGTDIVPVVQACQRWIDVTCQNGHAKIAPKPWASKMLGTSDRHSDFASLHFCRMLSGCEVPAMSCAGQGLLSAASRGEHGRLSQPSTDPSSKLFSYLPVQRPRAPSEVKFRDGEVFVLTVWRGQDGNKSEEKLRFFIQNQAVSVSHGPSPNLTYLKKIHSYHYS